jgi:hypothetical protein
VFVVPFDERLPMQEFTTRGNRHDFKVNGRSYWLPGATLNDYERVAQLGDLKPEEQVPAFRGLLLERAQPQGWRALLHGRSARRAVGELSMVQASALFKAWVAPGADLGESSGSPDK